MSSTFWTVCMDDFDTTRQSYGDTEKWIQAIERRAQKDEIKSKYQAFQLHFNHICNLQENLQQLSKIDENNNKKNKINNDIECIRSELKSSLEILKRCKNELEEAKLSRSRVFCCVFAGEHTEKLLIENDKNEWSVLDACCS